MADNWWSDTPTAAQGGWWSSAPVVTPDKYQQAAQEDVAAAQKAGVPQDTGFAHRVVSGMTLGALPTIMAGLETPLEMVKRGTLDPSEAYSYAKARENLLNQKSQENTGGLGTAAEIAGGVLTGGNAAKAGLTFLKPGQGLAARTGAMAGEGAAYGGLTGFNEGEGMDRLTGAGKGAALGAALGGTLPLAGSAISTAASPVISNILARTDPEGAARARLARALMESGIGPADVGQNVANAAKAGQPMFTVADALGNPGQRLLSTVTRAPGEGRTEAVNFLENRQAGQARRVSNALAEGLNAPETADQTITALKAQRKAAADANYGAARTDAGAVNVTPALDAADSQLPTGVAAASGLPDNSLEGTVRAARGMLSNGQEQVTDFSRALQIKKELDFQIENASPSLQRALGPIRDALDDQLAATSKPYAAARDTFRQQSQAIEAVPQGRAAAMRGRHEDTIPAFQGMAPEQQSAFRVGYADPLIEQTNNAAIGVNKVRPLLADGPQAELSAFAAPGEGQRLGERLARENTMFETRNHALGGSKTADNLADEAASGIDPRIFWNLVHGNVGGAISNVIHHSGNALTGNTPAVRSQLAQLLLARGSDPQMGTTMSEIVAQLQRRQQLGAFLGRTATTAQGEGVGQR
jgi:hypothetical protein